MSVTDSTGLTWFELALEVADVDVDLATGTLAVLGFLGSEVVAFGHGRSELRVFLQAADEKAAAARAGEIAGSLHDVAVRTGLRALDENVWRDDWKRHFARMSVGERLEIFPPWDSRHAFFKALLFLAAGFIMGMHHNQDIRYMAGLRKYMPITWITSLVGSLALIGTPFLSGFYSKDSIIEAVKFSHLPGSGIAYIAVLLGVFVTAFYSFRLYFLVFHGKERFHNAHHHHHEVQEHAGPSRPCPARVALGGDHPAAGAGSAFAGHWLHDHRSDAVRRVFRQRPDPERGYVQCPACGTDQARGAVECPECGLALAGETGAEEPGE